MRRRRLMLCPDCSRRGVYLKLGMDDAYVCRYAYRGCTFYAYARGTMTVDLDGRHRLSAANPGCVI
jgi:hypothetical protein